MRFEQTPIAGVWVIELDRLRDERGWFARAFDAEEFRDRGLEADIVQVNIAYNARTGTLRGMHFQREPHGEAKLVRCLRGATYHVALDLRPRSPTYCGWHAVELSPDARRALYIAPGLAHGSQTLRDECEVLYLMGHRHVPAAADGVRWDDPAFAIEWPELRAGVGRIISERDRAYPDFVP